MNLPRIDALDLTGIHTQVDEHGNASVWMEDEAAPRGVRLVGLWYRDRSGQLVDNLQGGSEDWTSEVADRALRAQHA